MLAIADTGESSEARPTLRAHFAAVGGHASRNYVRCGSDSAIGWPRDTTASPPDRPCRCRSRCRPRRASALVAGRANRSAAKFHRHPIHRRVARFIRAVRTQWRSAARPRLRWRRPARRIGAPVTCTARLLRRTHPPPTEPND